MSELKNSSDCFMLFKRFYGFSGVEDAVYWVSLCLVGYSRFTGTRFAIFVSVRLISQIKA